MCEVVTLIALQVDGVGAVADLHVWELKPGLPLLSAHLEMVSDSDASEVLLEATRYCRGLGIAHSTFQLCVQ